MVPPIRNQINTIDYNLTKLQEKYNLDKDKKISVIFSQVLWDANLFMGKIYLMMRVIGL